MIYEIDTLFDCIIIATIYDENLNVISSKELQSSYSTLYRGESLNKLIQNIIDGSKDFLESNSNQNGLNWTEKFFDTNIWSSLDISVTLLNNPRIYETEEDADKMHFLIKRAYQFCKKHYTEIDVYDDYFYVYTNSYKYKIQMDNSIYLKVEKIIKDYFPYYSHVTYIDYPSDIITVINNFDSYVNKF